MFVCLLFAGYWVDGGLCGAWLVGQMGDGSESEGLRCTD